MNGLKQESNINRGVALFGICGGIAAYKAVSAVRLAARSGWQARVVMSRGAREFVQPLTFQAITGRAVQTEMFPGPDGGTREELFPHLFPASEADAFILLPATADMLARVALGLADDPVAASVLALSPGCIRIFCPAMHPAMWSQKIVRHHARRLADDGWLQVGPGEGQTACGVSGPGRMAEPEDVVATLNAGGEDGQPLQGKRLLLLSGATREYFDTVRFISNASTGRMGEALAREAAERGATVDLVYGPTAAASRRLPDTVSVYPVTSAEDMLRQAESLFPQCDAAIFAAAVSDYRPAEKKAVKGAKSAGGHNLKLEPTPDIAAILGGRKNPGQITIGFSLGDELDPTAARRKMESKKMDAIVINSTAAIGADRAEYRLLEAGCDRPQDWGVMEKRECARRLMEILRKRFAGN